MSATVSLKQLRSDAEQVTLKAGDRVVFLPMGGIWGELRWLTGTIKKKNKDPVWRYDVEIDLPHLLYPGVDHVRGDDFITCVGPTAVVALDEIFKEDIPKLNRGHGPDGILPSMSKLCALRRLWSQMLAMDEKQVKDCTEHLDKYPSSESARDQLKRLNTSIARIRKVVSGYSKKIEKLKKKGAVEPCCESQVDA
jgi:hypothetical protein